MKDREKKMVSEPLSCKKLTVVYILLLQFKEFVDIVDDMIREIHQEGKRKVQREVKNINYANSFLIQSRNYRIES